MPLAAFPKCFLDWICIEGRMTPEEWIDLASEHLDIDGLEFFINFTPTDDSQRMDALRDQAARHQLKIPMMCCSPDFTKPTRQERLTEIEHQKKSIEVQFLPSPIWSKAPRGYDSRRNPIRGRVHSRVPSFCRETRHYPELGEPLQGQLLELPRACSKTRCILGAPRCSWRAPKFWSELRSVQRGGCGRRSDRVASTDQAPSRDHACKRPIL